MDEELDKLEKEEAGMGNSGVNPNLDPRTVREPKTQEEFMRGTSGAAPNTKIEIKGGSTKYNEAEDLKNQGNSFFVSLNFEQAASCYTKCINTKPKDMDLLKTVYSNRAQAYLKLRKYKEAEADASEALNIDNNHIKSLHRRGTARYHLEQYRLSREDLVKAL